MIIGSDLSPTIQVFNAETRMRRSDLPHPRLDPSWHMGSVDH